MEANLLDTFVKWETLASQVSHFQMGSVTALKAVTENSMKNVGKTFPRGFLENPWFKFNKGGLELTASTRAFRQAQIC